MKKTLYLRDLLSFIAYGTALHPMEIPRKERCRYGNTIVNDYEYIFPVSDEITRETIEQYYSELLDREIADGIHGDGERGGIYIHLYKDPERTRKCSGRKRLVKRKLVVRKKSGMVKHLTEM